MTPSRDRFSRDTLNAYVEGRVRELSNEITRMGTVLVSAEVRLLKTNRLGGVIMELRKLQNYFNLNK